MYKFTREQLMELLTEVYKDGYHGYLDLCSLVVENHLDKCKEEPEYSNAYTINSTIGSTNVPNITLVDHSLENLTIVSGD